MDFRIKIFTYLVLFFITTSITAQNNLVFNKVLVFKISNGNSVEVPSGKTWKIENIKSDSNGGITIEKSSVDYGDPITNNYFFQNSGSGNNTWLQEGTIINGRTSSGEVYSILEFNIEPISSDSDTNIVSGGVNSDGLQFSRVINKVFTSSEFINPNPTSSSSFRIAGEIQVPSGKVWKINDVQTYYERPDNSGNPGSQPAYCNILLGDYFFTTPLETRKDIYLTSGTHMVKFVVSSGTSSSFQIINKVTINAIEYDE